MSVIPWLSGASTISVLTVVVSTKVTWATVSLVASKSFNACTLALVSMIEPFINTGLTDELSVI